MMRDNAGFASPRSRSEAFPSGLRVLVVDDDLTWLKILEKMLKKCLYEVTTCCLAREALSLLRERKDGFDIVISDVNMPDMDGFKLLEHVGLEMDLPVIMMSVDGETSRVMKGVQHGACDYLLKPIRMKELRNIWQHVLRKRIHEVRDVDNSESFEAIQMMRVGCEQSDARYHLSGGRDMSATRKRKDVDNKHRDRELGDAFSKRARVVWTVDLHQKFVKAVNLIGLEKIGPKKILDSMNVPWLTRENVASHLQKYRLYLSRLQKDDGDKQLDMYNHLDLSYCRVNHSDTLTIETEEIFFRTQEPNTSKHYDSANGSYSSNRCSSGDLNIQDTRSKYYMLSRLTTEANMNSGAYEPQNMSASWLGASQCFGLVESDTRFEFLDSTVASKYSRTVENRDRQFGDVSKQQQLLDDGFNNWALHPQLDHMKPSLPSVEGSSKSKKQIIIPVTVEPTLPVDRALSANKVKSRRERETSIEINPPSAKQQTYHESVKRKASHDRYTSSLQLHTLPNPLMSSPSDILETYNRESHDSGSVKCKALCTERVSSSIKDGGVSSETIDAFRSQTDGRFLDHQSFKPIGAPSFDAFYNLKTRFEPSDSELALIAFGKDYKVRWDQVECNSPPTSYDFHDPNGTDLMVVVPVHLYDALRFDCCSEAPRFPLID